MSNRPIFYGNVSDFFHRLQKVVRENSLVFDLLELACLSVVTF